MTDDDILGCFASGNGTGQGQYMVSVGRAIETLAKAEAQPPVQQKGEGLTDTIRRLATSGGDAEELLAQIAALASTPHSAAPRIVPADRLPQKPEQLISYEDEHFDIPASTRRRATVVHRAAPEAQSQADDHLIPVDAAMLLRLLRALNGPAHWIREMQATRNIDGLSGVPSNPLNVLRKQYEEWVRGRTALQQPVSGK